MLLSLALSDPAMRPAIVYCGTRREVEEVSEQLRLEGRLAVGYHAGMPADERASAQHRFMTGDAEIVVATNAFGMGVDKADVRSVIHWAIPKSVEAYYQEVGRAGRDGLPSRAILLSSRADLGRLINFIKGDAVEVGDVLGYVERLRAGAAGGSLVIDAPRADRDRVCLGVAERAGFCRLEPARGGQLAVRLIDSGSAGQVASICREARDRAWAASRRRGLLLELGHMPPPDAARPLRRCQRGHPRGALLRRLRFRHDRPPRPGVAYAGSAQAPASDRGHGYRCRGAAAARGAPRLADPRKRREACLHRRAQQHARGDRDPAPRLIGRA
jgi:ATP-dependent DNA helicase RecQ